MVKDKEEIRTEIREELDQSEMFVVSPSMKQYHKTVKVLEEMRRSGEVRRGDETDESYTHPRNVYIQN